MSYILFEDGQLMNNYNGVLWDGLWSKIMSNGNIIHYIQSCLPLNSVLLIPKSDGNINKNKTNNDINWDTQIQPFVDYAKNKNKIFIIGTLSQIYEEPDFNYLYIPLDDDLFNNGTTTFFKKEELSLWENRSSQLCWRGGCSGYGGLNSTRVRFVETIYNYNKNTNIRLSNWWSEGKHIPEHYFDDRIHYTEFTKYKIFFIVDGAVIASNHMYGFATGCIPFLISNAVCWFSHLIKPYVHYIPINYDLSNLIEQIEWVNNNDSVSKLIAENAYKFAETYFSSEYQHQYIKYSIDKIYTHK
jgi:hypothetical protein